MNEQPVFQVSDFIAYFNQTIEYAYGDVLIEGEVSNFKLSKNKWVYFDLKDDSSSVKFFGSVYSLPGPVQDGMLVRVVGTPRLHNLYGFSVTFKSLSFVGEGSIKKASEILRIKLKKEGLFDESRKRRLPFVPSSIGLVTSSESAAYKDFIKILNNRWSGITISLYDVGVQGLESVGQNLKAIEYFSSLPKPPEVIVITRGGGSKDDLAVYDDERVVRAVAGSKVPTVVAIGHEMDMSLAELVADRRASTPSNAAEILTPEKSAVLNTLIKTSSSIKTLLLNNVDRELDELNKYKREIRLSISRKVSLMNAEITSYKELLLALSPENALKRGYAILRNAHEKGVIKSINELTKGQSLRAELYDGYIDLEINNIEVK